MLTARTEVADRVSGLDAGADDYLAKPFSLDELLARLRSLLRRSTYDAEEPTEVTVEDLVIDEAARRAWRGEREMELTKTEFDLLQLLAHNAGVVLRTPPSTTASGATTSVPTPRPSPSTSATSAARPRRAASPASSRPSAASATR